MTNFMAYRESLTLRHLIAINRDDRSVAAAADAGFT